MWLSLAFKILAKGLLSLPARLTRKFTRINRSFLKELMVSFSFICYLHFSSTFLLISFD